MNLVEVRVQGPLQDPKTQQYAVVLRELDGTRMFPIFIGPAEAAAIARLLSGESFPRPLTHDLIQLILDGLKARVTRVVIADLRESTFFANLYIERGDEHLVIDARPSDSIAIALRAQVPILVNETLLQVAAPMPGPDEPGEPSAEKTEEERAEELRRFLEGLNPEDFGKFNL